MGTRVTLQAILLADSITKKFEPITLECPKVLLPLVNTPMIDYTLSWLESSDVEQVFVLCSSQHSKQIINYLENSKWANKPSFSVKTIESLNAGDALRDVIHGDFILVSGDTVTNMNLTDAIEEHKERKQNGNKNADVMTMVIKQSEPCDQAYKKTGELIMAIDPTTKELVYYEDKTTNDLKFNKSFLTVNPCLSLHNDKQDCYIDICSPQALGLLFTKDIDFVDYQQLRRDFFKGLLVDDHHLMGGFKIFTHEIDSSCCYAARIDSFKSYKSISKDIIQRRRTYNPTTKLEQVGKDTCIGDKTVISNDSVVGDGCNIGCNVSIEGCYIWNNVTIQDGCKLRGAVLCDGVVMKPGAVLEPGVVLSYKVVVGPGFVVPCCSRVSLLPQHSQDKKLDTINGCGFIWSMSEVDHEKEEECRHSVVEPKPKPDLDVMLEKAVESIFSGAGDGKNAARIYNTLSSVDSVRLDYDIDSEKFVGALVRLIMKLALDTWRNNNCNDLVTETEDVISNWGKMLRGYSGRVDEKTLVIMTFEDLCLGSMKEYAPFFVEVLNILYDKKIIQADEILEWAHRKEHTADESDKTFVKQSEKFVQRLKEEKDQEEADLKRLNEGGVQVKKSRVMS